MAEHPAPLRRIQTGPDAPSVPQWQRPAGSTADLARPPLPESALPDPPAAPQPSGRRLRFVILGTILGLLTVGVIGLGAAFAFRALLGHEDRMTAGYAPADSYAYLAFNTDRSSRAWLDAWNMAEDLGLADDLAQLPRDAAKQIGLDPSLWNEPLRPAIGEEVGFALWPNAADTSEPHMALLVQIGDAEAAEAAIPVLLEDDTPTAATYRDVTYYTGTDDEDVAGIVDDVLVFAGSVFAFEGVVDARRDGALEQVAAFTTAAERAAESPLLFVYIDTTTIGALMDEVAPIEAFGDEVPVADWGQVTITLKAEEDVLRLTTLSSARPEMMANLGNSADLDAFSSEMPANVFLLLAGYDLYATVWQPVTEQMAELNDALGDSAELDTAELLDMFTAFDFDIDTGFFGQLRGDYALGAALSGDGTLSGADVRFMADVADPAVVALTLDDLADMVALSGLPLERDEGGFSISTEGVSATVRLEGDTLRMGVSYQFDETAAGSLADNPSFRRAVAVLPENSGVAGYIALQPLWALLPPDAFADLDPQAQVVVEAISAIAFSYGTDGDGVRGDVLLLLSGDE